MAEISASTVMKLRKMSGQGMMDCKKALGETDGDVEKAMELLRKKGLATLVKRAGRETSQGIVISKSDDKCTILTALCCETDFVALSEGFVATVDTLADHAIACQADCGIEALLETTLDGKPFSEVLTILVSKTGEKTEVGDYAKYKAQAKSLIGSYIHFNKKIGAMLEIELSDEKLADNDALKTLANEIAMHITATAPAALDKNSIDPEIIEKEKRIATEQMANKPPEIIEKIVEGKIRKFLADNCLVDQPFVKDDSKSVEQLLNDASKAAGGEAKIKRFVRFDVG